MLLIRSRILIVCALVCAAASTAAAQFTSLSGNLSDSTTGPLVTGTVYRVVSSVLVPAGQTLTVQPGVIIKMNFDTTFSVAGTLNVNGTVAQPCFITSDTDDSVGGDTNANGPSSGVPDSWRNLTFLAGSTGNLTRLTVRYGGRFGSANIAGSGATLTLTNCTSSDCSFAGFSMNNTPAAVTVTGCAFNANLAPLTAIPLQSIAGFSANTATGNTGPDAMLVATGTIAANTTIPAAAMINGAIVLDGSISVQSGTTLTIDAGVVLKVRALDLMFTVAGALNVNGTVGQPVVVTTFADDTVAGDTNENGPSTTSLDFWRSIDFAATAAPSTLSNLTVRGGGRFGSGQIRLAGSRANLTNVVLDNCSSSALEMQNAVPQSGSTFVGCAFNLSMRAVGNCPINAVPMFTNCTAAGNSSYNSIEVTSATVSGSVALQQSNMIGGTIVMIGAPTIPSGATLTLGPGVVIKNDLDRIWTVNGTLIAAGTAGNPAVITNITDDAFAGDTNKDGATGLQLDYWRGIYFNAGSGPSSLDHLTLRGGGRFGSAAFNLAGGPVVATNCTIDRFSNACVDVQNTASTFTIANCAFTNSQIAVRNCHINAIANFQNCTASGNSIANTIVVTASTVSGTATIGAANMIGGVVRFDVSPTVPVGATLNLDPGTVLKMSIDMIFTVDGTLNVQSASGMPVVVTDINDDSVAGDTNLNGASGSQKDFWRGIFLNATSGASSIEGMVVRGAGRFGNAVVRVLSNATIIGLTVDNGSTSGVSFGGSTATPIIRNLTVTNCNGFAMDLCTWASFENIRGVQTAGNGAEAARVTSSVCGADADVYAYSAPSGVVYPTAGVFVAAGELLRLHPGVIVKFPLDGQTNIAGAIEALGSGFEPVVFTNENDDVYGGNTFHNGPGSAEPDYWRQLTIPAGAAPSILNHVIVRNAGRFGSAGISCASPLARITSVRVEYCSQRGFAISALQGALLNAVAFANGSHGIGATGGSFDIIHATTYQNGGNGISAAAAWTGVIHNTIAWANTAGNYSGVSASNLFDSDGSPTLVGTNNNINVNPALESPATGDLHLSAGSPCLDVADSVAASLTKNDFDDNSRILDHVLNGAVVPDMGAYERGHWHLSVTGTAEMGGIQTYELTGATLGLGALFAGTGLNTDFSNPYGYILADSIPNLFLIAFLPTGQPFSVQIPTYPFLAGFSFTVQGLVVLPSNTTRGNVTEAYRGTIFE